MKTIQKIERLLLKEFETVPFHNLFMLNNKNIVGSDLGGTCSDKVLHFKKVLNQNGIDSRLHSAIINGKECHRMLSVLIEKKKYFIDPGSGWPSIRLIPESQSTEYTVFGMSFKTESVDDKILLFHKTDKGYKLMLTIPLISKDEIDILNAIENRFADKSIYPFQNSLRFSKIIGNDFYFLKGNVLKIYTESSICEYTLNTDEIYNLIINTFKFDLTSTKILIYGI